MSAPTISYRLDAQAQPYKFLWLAYVTAVRLDEHCARSLIGKRDTVVASRHLGPDVVAGSDHLLDQASAKTFYLCGLPEPYSWEGNAHLAFTHAPGKTIQREWRGLRVLVDDAAELPVDDQHIAPDHPRAGDRKFATCRNWQHAWFLHRELGLEDRSAPPPPD